MIQTCSVLEAETYLSSVLAFELESLIVRSAHFWLLGGPRSGKTTLAMNLAEKWTAVTGDEWAVKCADEPTGWADEQLSLLKRGERLAEYLQHRDPNENLILEGQAVAWAPMSFRIPDVLVYLAGVTPQAQRSREERKVTGRIFDRFVEVKHPKKLIIYNPGSEWTKEVQ